MLSKRIRDGEPPLAVVELPDEGIASFRSESTPQPGPIRSSESSRARQLVLVVAALAVLEAVPAGLWLHQAIASPKAAAPNSVPPAPAAVAAAAGEPCVAPAAESTLASGPPIAAKGSQRTPAAAKGTSGPAAVVVPKSVGGLLSVTAPVAMHIYASGRIVGTTEAETVMLPVGNHDLWFVNDQVGYKVRRSVAVQAGKTTKIELESPMGTVHVNAAPWADVWVDNQRIGETPIGNLQVPIGTREFVFKHPELGERRKTAVVTLKEPVRVSMDMRSK